MTEQRAMYGDAASEIQGWERVLGKDAVTNSIRQNALFQRWWLEAGCNLGVPKEALFKTWMAALSANLK
jgi:hypothetical protein